MAFGDFTNPTWVNGNVFSANNLQPITNKVNELDKYAIPKYKKKVADEIVNNSTAWNDDNDLNITFPARAAVYEIELVAFVEGPDVANFKSTWVTGGGTSSLTSRNCYGATPTNGDATYSVKIQNIGSGISSVQNYGTDGTYATSIIERFLVSTTASTSTLKWQWAQNTATASNTTVKASTYMKITEMKAWS